MFTKRTGRALLAATSLAVSLGLAGAVPAAIAEAGFFAPNINVFSNNGDDALNVIGDCSPVLMLIMAQGNGRNGTCDNIETRPEDSFGGFGTASSGGGRGGSGLLNLLSHNGDDGINVIGDCSHGLMLIFANGDSTNGTCDNVTNEINIFPGEGEPLAQGAAASSDENSGPGGLLDVLSGNGDDGVNVIGDCSSILTLIFASDESRNGTCDNETNILNIFDGGFGGF